LIANNAKFLDLVSEKHIRAALKSYSDSILFYYLGYLSATNASGKISEIGVGGSTYILTELSELANKEFVIIDNDANRIHFFKNTTHWPKANVSTIVDDSVTVAQYKDIPKFSYGHVDGTKNFKTTVSDINFYLDHLAVNGLVCQDDYGNHKWPTVTDAVKQIEYEGRLKIVLVGDSSVWFTKPEYYDYWMGLLKTDYEFSLLTPLCNIVSSTLLERTPEYFFMQATLNHSIVEDYSPEEIEYFNTLLKNSPEKQSNSEYLKMPYLAQSAIGVELGTNPDYLIPTIYNIIRGKDWPVNPPTTEEELAQLPDWIKDEIQSTLNINIFKKVKNKNLDYL
jgi:hypothetical protein